MKYVSLCFTALLFTYSIGISVLLTLLRWFPDSVPAWSPFTAWPDAAQFLSRFHSPPGFIGYLLLPSCLFLLLQLKQVYADLVRH